MRKLVLGLGVGIICLLLGGTLVAVVGTLVVPPLLVGLFAPHPAADR